MTPVPIPLTRGREFSSALKGQRLVDEARQSLNGLFNPADYPAPDKISGLFTMRVDVDPMPTAEDFRVALSEDENARKRRKRNLNRRL